MFLEIDGLTLPDRLKIECFEENPSGGEWADYRRRPKEWIPLGETAWPDEVKAQIVEFYKAIGVEDPLRQKLVEPYAKCFGGRNRDGAYDLDGVNWDAVVDYFRFEARSITAQTDDDRAVLEAMQAEAVEKYGGRLPMHYMVYGEDY